MLHNDNYYRYQGIELPGCDAKATEYALKRISLKARQLARQIRSAHQDQTDYWNDLLKDLLERLPKYNPKRAHIKTYIHRVVENMAATIIKKQQAMKRDYRLCSNSLNDRVKGQYGRISEWIDLLDQEGCLICKENLPQPLDEQTEMAIDIRAFVQELSPELRTVCQRLLRGEKIAEIALDMGIPRSTIYFTFEKLRSVAANKNLDKYL